MTMEQLQIERLEEQIDSLEQALRLSEKRYELVLDFTEITIFDYNIRTKQMRLPRSDVIDYGLPRVLEDAVEGLIAHGIILPQSHEVMRTLYHCIERGEPSATAVVYGQNKAGEDQILELTLVTIFDNNNQPVSAVGVRRNITESMQTKRELAYGNSLVAGKQFIYEANITTNRILTINSCWQQTCQIDAAQPYDQMVEQFCRGVVDPGDQEMVRQQLSESHIVAAFASGQKLMVLQYRQIKPSGLYEWCEQTLNVIEDQTSGDLVVRAYCTNVDEQKKQQLDLVHRSQHDLLTNMYNKATIEEKISCLLATGGGEGLLCAFLLIDLDYFKDINDNFGHVFGDAVLTRFSTMLRSLCKEGDLLGRLGGDEFVLAMWGLQDQNPAIAKAQDICTRIREIYNKNGEEYCLSASVGIAFYPSDGTTYHELYNNADKALYEAKRTGRNLFRVYQPGMLFTEKSGQSIYDISFFEKVTQQ